MMKKTLASILAFSIALTTSIPTSQATEEPVRITSQYLKNGYIYWDTSWSVEKRTQQNELNKAKVLNQIQNIRPDLTCQEQNLTRIEKAYCMIRESLSKRESTNELIVPNPNNGSTSISIFYSIMFTLGGTALGMFTSAMTYAKKAESYVNHFHYMSPRDLLIINNEEALLQHLPTTASKILDPHGFGFRGGPNNFGTLIMNTGIRFEITKETKGKEVINIARRLANGTIEIFETDVHTTQEILKSLAGMEQQRSQLYLHGVFKYRQNFFLSEEKLERELAQEITAMKQQVFEPLLDGSKEARIGSRKLFAEKWLEDSRYRFKKTLPISLGFIALLVGTTLYAIHSSPDAEPTHYIYVDDITKLDAEDLQTTVLDRSPEFLATLAMACDEIIAGVTDVTNVSSAK